MSEAVRTSVKAPEKKKENQVSQVQKSNFYQPLSSPVDQILYLQRTIGNQAVQKLMKSGALQAKLRIGAPGDVYEQEADRVAEQIMRMAEPKMVSGKTSDNPVQRACPKCPKYEEELYRKQGEEEEKEKLQAKSISHIPEINTDQENSINSLKSGGQPLPEPVRSFFEPRFSYDFSHVRVHTDAHASDMARAINARAFTLGTDVVFGSRQYEPGTTEGKGLLAHELVHVVQQGDIGGRRDGMERGNRISLFPDPADSREVTLTYLSGLVETRRVVRICDNGVVFFEPEGRAPISAFRSIAYQGGTLESNQLTAENLERFYNAVGLRPGACGIPFMPQCGCDPSTGANYDQETFRFIRSIRPYVQSIADAAGVPRNPVAGAIADEYNTRRGPRSLVDSIQDALIDSLPEFAIDVDRFFDIHSKLLNTLENDVGPANIKVRTALELVQRGELSVPGSPPSNIQVNQIVDFLLTERGTVEATAAVISRAQRLFGSNIASYPDYLSEAVLVEYFKQGESYYERFSRTLASNPNHQVCPGDGGCRFIHNRSAIQSALTSQPGVVRTGPASTMIVPDIEQWERAVQRKPITSQPGDRNEQEADTIADMVMEMTDRESSSLERVKQPSITHGTDILRLQRNPVLEESYIGKTFIIEDNAAVLRNEDLSIMKYREGEEIPEGKKAGNTKIIPKGSEVYVINTKVDSKKITYAYVLLKGPPLFGVLPNIMPLGWTAVTNFSGKFENIVTGTSEAIYDLPPVLDLNQTVWDPNALIRGGGPDYKPAGGKIAQGTYVLMLQSSEDTDPVGKYVRVMEVVHENDKYRLGREFGWTSASNLAAGWMDIFGSNAAWENGKYLGQVDLIDMVGTEGKSKRITAASFPNYMNMVKEAEKENIHIGLVSGFRSYPEQVYLYNGYIKGLPGFNQAAKPGYSNHQNGTAFDLNTSGNEGTGTGAIYNWLKDNSWKYGFIRTVSTEHWHWEYLPDKVQEGKHTTWGV